MIRTIIVDDEHDIIKAINLNCDGYINKGHKREELIAFIKNVYRGMNTYESKVQDIFRDYVFGNENPENSADINILSLLKKRELEIISLLTKGKTNAEIASELYISEGYVRNQLMEIREKLGLRNSKEMAVWGAKMGL